MEQRAAFPSGVEPNDNPPESVPPATVGENVYNPGDPEGLTIDESGLASSPVVWPAADLWPSPWSGWPAEWRTPLWGNVRAQELTDTAWACLDSNASLLSTMPPYLVGAAPSLSADWLTNPDPDLYSSWEEFAKQLFWGFQHVGEVFVLATARYATGYPARFHVVPPWMVEAEIGGDGLRRYKIGDEDITGDVLHLRYTSTVGDAHGHGPLEVAGPRLVAARALAQYARSTAAGIPSSILKAPRPLTAAQAGELQAQWVNARMNSLGLPAVLSGVVEFDTVQWSPTEMALVELSQWNEARIAILLRVPPHVMGLPSGGDSLTYSTVVMTNDYYWRAGLRPIAQAVMAGLSYWVLPRGTTVELNRDEFVRPGPFERAQTNAILLEHGVISVEEWREMERFGESSVGQRMPVEPEGVFQ